MRGQIEQPAKAVIPINVLPSPEHGPGCTGWPSRVLDFELRVESESDSPKATAARIQPRTDVTDITSVHKYGAAMRTTLTIDDDIAARIEERRRTNGQSL